MSLVENLTTNIFDEPTKDFGICTESFKGESTLTTTIGKNINKKSDERWAEAVKSKYGAIMSQMPTVIPKYTMLVW